MTFWIVAVVVALLALAAALAWWTSGRARPRQQVERTAGEAAMDRGKDEWGVRTGPHVPPTGG